MHDGLRLFCKAVLHPYGATRRALRMPLLKGRFDASRASYWKTPERTRRVPSCTPWRSISANALELARRGQLRFLVWMPLSSLSNKLNRAPKGGESEETIELPVNHYTMH